MRGSTWFGLVLVVAAGAAGYRAAAPGPRATPPVMVNDEAGDTAAQAALAAGDGWIRMAGAGGASPATSSDPLPQGSFGTTVDILRERTRAGDAAAARALYEGLRRCEGYEPLRDGESVEQRAEISTASGFDNAVRIADGFRALLQERGADTSIVPPVTVESVYAGQLDRWRTLAADCEGAGHVPIDAWRVAQAVASDLDDADARVSYWLEAFNQWSPLVEMPAQRDRALAGLRRALAAGDWRALAAIGEIHEEGWLAPPSPALAYAYLHAAMLGARGGGSVPLPWRTGLWTPAADDDIRRRLRRLESTLDAATREAARAYGEARHAACCAQGAP
ncbi:hypothetical protein ACQQ2N_20545 [Dokdonella sp. MW10]|uniref:hypothetical protein n=1 Tax=Dokdonella sp. MW10 TaxID=2992926 RepID=UPI003F81A998